MKKEATLAINPIRLNWHYVIWYKNFTVILISLVIPFVLLAYWNLNTLAVMIRRRRLRNRPAYSPRTDLESPLRLNVVMAAALLNADNIQPNSTSSSTSRLGTFYFMPIFEYILYIIGFSKFHIISQSYLILAKREEGRRAKILFAIVIFFVICNAPRAILDLEEFVVIAPSYWEKYKSMFDNSRIPSETSMKPLCYSPPFWARILHSISKLLLTLNASAGCLVYCAMCKIFRTELKNACHKVMSLATGIFRTCC